MKRMKTFCKLLIFLLIIGLSFSMIKALLYKNQVNEKTNEVKFLYDRIALQSDFSGYLSLPISFSVKSLDGDIIRLGEIVKETTIVLYIDRIQCLDCILSIIDGFLNYETKDSTDLKLIMLANGFNPREFKILTGDIDKRIDVYLIDTISLFFNKMQEAAKPFYFLLSPELEISNIFFPPYGNDYPRLIEDYFDRLERKIVNAPFKNFDKVGELEIINPIINMGNIKMKTKYTTVFKIKNVGKKPCLLISIKSSCGCMIPIMDLSPLMPDSTRIITVEIFQTKKGFFSKSITLKVASKSNPFFSMKVHGFVE